MLLDRHSDSCFCFDRALKNSCHGCRRVALTQTLTAIKVKRLPKTKSPARTVQLCWCRLCELWYPGLPTRSSASWDICERQWREVGHFWSDRGSAAFYSSIKKGLPQLHESFTEPHRREHFIHTYEQQIQFFLSRTCLCVSTNKCSQSFFVEPTQRIYLMAKDFWARCAVICNLEFCFVFLFMQCVVSPYNH